MLSYNLSCAQGGAQDPILHLDAGGGSRPQHRQRTSAGKGRLPINSHAGLGAETVGFVPDRHIQLGEHRRLRSGIEEVHAAGDDSPRVVGLVLEVEGPAGRRQSDLIVAGQIAP